VSQRLATVGLLGGMSWESTATYYRLVNEGVRERAGGLHSAPLLIWSVDFAEIGELQRTGDWAAAAEILAAAAVRLEGAGAAAIALCTNTMHRVADVIRDRLAVPLLSMVDVVGAETAERGWTRVGLLGTAFTMDSPLYPDALAVHGVEVLTPPAEDRQLVHRVIYDELCQGVVRDGSRQAYRRIIKELVARGAQAIVLGCTEIPMLVDVTDADVPLLDTTTLHAAAIVEFALHRSLTGVES
jgi:aspartate racemase